MLVSALRVESVTTCEGHTVLRPIGELESASIAVFRQAVADIGPRQRVIIDMAGMPFLDSCGIGALIGAVRRVRELDGAICIASVCPPVRRVLQLTGFDRIVEVAANVDESVAILDGLETESPAYDGPIATWAS